MSLHGRMSAETPSARGGHDVHGTGSPPFENVSSPNLASHFAGGISIHSMTDTPTSSSLLSTANASSTTSFRSLDDFVEGHQPRERLPVSATDPDMTSELLEIRVHIRSNVDVDVDIAGATSTSDDMPDATTSNPYVAQQNGTLSGTSSQGSTATISSLPPAILRQIFAITATRSYAARRVLPLVCHFFRLAMSDCPEMWDTFEIMTSNADALVSRKQVEYVVDKAGERSLSVGLALSSHSREMGREPVGEDSNASDQQHGVEPIRWVATIMGRIEDLILDIQDGDLDPETEGAMLSLFDERNMTRLKRLSLVGNHQLDRITRLKTPSTRTSSPSSIYSLSSLQSLSLAFSSSFSLPSELPQVANLELSVIYIDSYEGTSFHSFLECFPRLVSLAIHCLTGQPQRSTETTAPSDTITLHHLRKLVLDGLPLTCPTLSCLSTPNLYALELSDFDLGFDPRTIGFETTLAGHDTSNNETKGLRPLPFGDFLAGNSHWGTLRVLKLTKLPGVVARMCMDFTRIVGGIGNSNLEKQDGENRGLTHLHLADFAWSDWEALLGGAELVASRGPESTANTSSPTGSSVSLPYLRSLHVHLDHVSAWKTAGFMNGKHEDRQQWMDGLMSFAERRISRRALVGMLRQFNVVAPSWLVGETEEQREKAMKAVLDDPARTVDQISLDTGFTDSLAFTHSAWLLLQGEQGELAAS